MIFGVLCACERVVGTCGRGDLLQVGSFPLPTAWDGMAERDLRRGGAKVIHTSIQHPSGGLALVVVG